MLSLPAKANKNAAPVQKKIIAMTSMLLKTLLLVSCVL